jgi:HD superfamily phosphohydrolase YqeK
MIDRLWKEIDKIQDVAIHDFTLKVAQAAPEASWSLSSSRDHHMRDECGEWGNLIHTLRVCAVCDVYADIFKMKQLSKDKLKSAAILHDSCKHGVDAQYVYICREHPYLVRELCKKAGADNPEIIAIIEQHMGRWGTVDYEWKDSYALSLAFLLHSADCIEARLDTLIEI